MEPKVTHVLSHLAATFSGMGESATMTQQEIAEVLPELYAPRQRRPRRGSKAGRNLIKNNQGDRLDFIRRRRMRRRFDAGVGGIPDADLAALTAAAERRALRDAKRLRNFQRQEGIHVA